MFRCRCEYFVFSLWAEMLGSSVELYAITCDGLLHHYPKVKVVGAEFMPSGGALSNPKDKESVRKIENIMICEYGKAISVAKCKEGKEVDLSAKMIRAEHVEALGAAVNEYKVISLNLNNNQLGAEGAKAIASLLEVNTTLTNIKYATTCPKSYCQQPPSRKSSTPSHTSSARVSSPKSVAPVEESQ